jgi:hypothetical protein
VNVAIQTLTIQPPEVEEWLQDNLTQKYDYQVLRIKTALMYTVAATLGAIIGLIVASMLNLPNVNPLPEANNFYAEFLEWRGKGLEDPVCIWHCEIVTQVKRLVSNAIIIGASIITEGHEGNIVAMARLCSLISVIFAVGFAFRQQLPQFYSLNAQKAELEDFQNTPGWELWLSRILYTLASLFGTYVVVSILGFGLSKAFKELTLNWFNALLVIIVFTGTMTFAAVFGALAVTTRGVLLLGLFTVMIGLAVSFALAPEIDDQQWWLKAVSSAGQFNPSAPIFTGTLMSGSLTLVVLWFDINRMIHKMIIDGDVKLLTANQWMWVARILYATVVLGLFFVGLIRVDKANFAVNSWFHAGGAVAAIASVAISGLLIRKRRFHPLYKFFSVYIQLGVTIALIVLGSLKLESPWIGSPGTGIINMTVLELSLFALMGLWGYLTVNNLVVQANIRALAKSRTAYLKRGAH